MPSHLATALSIVVMRRLRVLLSAFYCSPYRGSESAVGWQIASGLAEFHDVTVICGDLSEQAPTRTEIERYRASPGLPDGMEVVHVRAPDLARKIHSLHRLPGLWFLYYEAYRRWQRQALEEARRLHAESPFDLVHHVTVVGFREPGYLWQLGVPFFWGPVSGATVVPPAYGKDFGPKERLRWTTHRWLNRAQIYRGGRAKEAALAAAKIWAVCKEDAQVLRGWGAEAELMAEVACHPSESRSTRERGRDEVLWLCWSGIFQGRKALPLLLRALAKVDVKFQLDVVGDGPEGGRWRKLAHSLGIGHQIAWHGMLSREQALAVMEKAHALVHSSVKEASSTVVLEAVERGIPVICHDACGMGTLVNESCGIKIPISGPDESVAGFARAITRLAAEPGLVGVLSRGALFRAAELTWKEKVRRISAAYLSVTGRWRS